MPKGWYAFIEQNQHINDRFPCVWKDIQSLGYTIGMFNVPLTYPAFPVNGWIVGGFPCFPTPHRLAYPPRIYQHLKKFNHFLDLYKKTHQYPDDPEEGKGGVHLQTDDEQAFQEILRLIENRLNIFDSILSVYPVDVAMIGYSYLDHAGHLGFNINGLYTNQTVNLSINSILEITEAKKAIIVSDHGAYFFAVPVEEDSDVLSIGLNHSKDAVLFVKGASIKTSKVLHEWDIKKIILDVLNQ